MAITGVHVTLYCSEGQAEELRTFLRDTLEIPGFDAGGGWLIFQLAGEIAPHPDAEAAGEAATPDLAFACADLQRTVAELERKGVEFVMEIADEGWGLRTRFRLPAGLEADLYEPRYHAPDRRG